MTIIILSIIAALTALVWLTGTILPWAMVLLVFAWPIAVFTGLLQGEGLGVTVLLHRAMSHASLRIKARWLDLLLLWLARSGGAVGKEWALNHIKHHPTAGTPYDSYSPNVAMVLGTRPVKEPRYKRIHRLWGLRPVVRTRKVFRKILLLGPKPDRSVMFPPLRKPSLLRFRYDNTMAYFNSTTYRTVDDPGFMERLADQYPEVRRGLTATARYDWAEDYCNRVWRARWIDGAIFAISLLPLAIWLGPVWGPVAVVVLTPLMVLLKINFYLQFGYDVNYWGHMGKNGLPDWCNITGLRMLYTFFLWGECWHEQHHDKPSARFHDKWDPGWWFIKWCYRHDWVGDIMVAEPTGVPREYRLIRYDPRRQDEPERQLIAA